MGDFRSRSGDARRIGVATAAVVASALVLAGCAAGPLGGDAARSDGAVVRECSGGASIDLGCFRERYDALVVRRGPRPAIADLLARRARSGYVRAACHQLMHVIGRAAGRRRGIRAFEQGDASCSSGYYHGVVEAVTGQIGGHDVLREATRVCAPYRERRPGSLAHYNCAHGMGHGFMGVFASDVRRSLEGCDRLPAWEAEHCEGGVFMENLTAMDDPERPSRALRPQDPLFPCTAVPRRYKASCYIKQTAYPVFLTGGDFAAVFALCARTPDVAFRPACHRGLGGNAVIRAAKYVDEPADVRATVRELCLLGPTAAARRECVEGAATVVVKDGATRTLHLRALCASFRQRDLRATCARTAARELARFDVAVPAAAAADRPAEGGPGHVRPPGDGRAATAGQEPPAPPASTRGTG